MKTVEVDFVVGDGVLITDIGAGGTVEGVWLDRGVTKYDVQWYTTDKAAVNRWFVASQLEAIG